jgi:hypothetical protein
MRQLEWEMSMPHFKLVCGKTPSQSFLSQLQKVKDDN